MKSRGIAAIISALALAGCVSADQRAAKERQERAEAAHRQAVYQESLRTRCESYGFRQGTEPFASCLMQIDQAKRSQDAAAKDAAAMMLLQQRLQSPPR